MNTTDTLNGLTVDKKPRGKVMIYGAGGCGTNISNTYNNVSEIAGFADLSVVYVDTSTSNLKANIEPKQFYHISTPEDVKLDGSGGVRRSNAAHIASNIKPMLKAHPFAQFNIVVYAATGGSGSVIGPEIHAELLRQGANVISVVIGSDESEIRAVNVVNVLKSLENVALNTKRPVVMAYAHNTRGQARSVADDKARFYITALSILFSRAFEELDTTDLVHWLDYTKIPTIQLAPQLVELKFITDTVEVDKQKAPISIASLYTDATVVPYTIRSRYDCKGYGKIPYEGREALHYSISADTVADVYATVEKDTRELRSEHDSHVYRSSITDSTDKPTSSGMVL